MNWTDHTNHPVYHFSKLSFRNYDIEVRNLGNDLLGKTSVDVQHVYTILLLRNVRSCPPEHVLGGSLKSLFVFILLKS